MSTTPKSTDEDPSKEEENLLTIAETDLDSAVYAKAILREKYGYEEGELP